MRLAPAVALFSLCLLAACGKSPQEAAVSAASGGKVDMEQEGDKTTIKTADGTMTVATGDSAEIPATFPKDVWLPGRYQVKTAADFGGASILDLQVEDAVAAATAAASAGMDEQNWKQTMTMEQDGTHVLMFEKDGRVATYSVRKDEDGPGSRVAVQVAPRQR